MKNLSLALIFLLGLSLMQSCKKDENPDPPAPELPAVESLIMPFTGFENADTGRSFNNWFYAASNVVIWNVVLTVNLAIPTASFYESFKHPAEFQGNSTWLWAYEFTANGSTYEAELYGQLQGTTEVKWDMYIAKRGGFSQVHWYSGVTANDRSYASWTLNHKPHNPESFIGVEYQRDNSSNLESIRYTNIIPGVPETGDYIEYRTDDGSTSPYNRAYDVFDISEDNMLQINWNSTTNEGRVKNPNHFNDEKWHCWNTELKDTQC